MSKSGFIFIQDQKAVIIKTIRNDIININRCMLIKVKVFPNSKKQMVAKKEEDEFEVRVKEKPERGKANQAVKDVLAEYFNVPKENIRMIRGFKSRSKIFEIKANI